MNLKDLISQAQDLELQFLQENVKRSEIKRSEMYQIYADKIAEFTLLQKEMLDDVTDSTEELYEVKQKILQEFKDKQLEEYGNAFARFKTKQSVNTTRLLNTIGGDIDIFCTLVEISQKKLKEYANDNKDIKKALLGCIQTDSKEIIDITIKQ